MTVESQQEQIRKGKIEKAPGSFMQDHWQKLVALALWLLLIGAYYWYTSTNNLQPLEAARQLLDLIRGTAFGPLLFIIIYTLRPLIFFSAAILTLSGGFLFGPFWGVIYSLTGGTLSALMAYWIGYFFGEGLLAENPSGNVLQRYADRMRRSGFETVLIMRFLFLPFDLVSYLAGFLRVDWKAFIFATFLGSIPGGIAIALAGASGDFSEDGLSINPWILLIAAILFVLSLILSRYMRRREGSKV